MYSDVWIKDDSIQKSIPYDVTDEANIEYWHDRDHHIVGVKLNFEFADDVHYELTWDNWLIFLEKVLHHTERGDGLKKLAAFLKGKLPHIKFEHALQKHGIEYKKMAFFHLDF